MKKYFFKVSFWIAALLPIVLPVRAFAALDPGVIKGAVGDTIPTDSDITSIVVNVVSWILVATGTVAVLFILIGGFRYITSAGNETQAEAAKETITKAIIGLVIVLLAYVIVSTINQVLGSGGSGACHKTPGGNIGCIL